MEAIKLIGEILGSNITRNIFMIVAASVAFIIYYLNKKDNFRNASNIILQEIKEVENVVSNVRTGQIININLPILKSNSWNEYKHHFVKKLDQDEFEQLNNFYIISETIENERVKVSNSLTTAMEEKEKSLQKLLIDLAKEYSDDFEKYNKKKQECLQIIHKEEYYFEPSAPKEKLNQAISSIPNILNTNIGLKLKRFSK